MADRSQLPGRRRRPDAEAAQAERERRRDRLVAATHAGLADSATTASPPATIHHSLFTIHYSPSTFFIRHLPRLTTRPEEIKQLRQTILNLAVRGRLVPQDPNDEPAADLLKRIKADGKHASKERGQNATSMFAELSENDRPFDVPRNWAWVRLCELLPEFQNGESSRGQPGGQPTVVLRLADIKHGQISVEDTRTLPLAKGSAVKYRLRGGDILVVRVNGSTDIVGQFIHCDREVDAIYCDHFIRMRIRLAWLAPEFLCLMGTSALIRDPIKNLFVTSAGQKTVNQGHIGSLMVALPPSSSSAGSSPRWTD